LQSIFSYNRIARFLRAESYVRKIRRPEPAASSVIFSVVRKRDEIWLSVQIAMIGRKAAYVAASFYGFAQECQRSHSALMKLTVSAGQSEAAAASERGQTKPAEPFVHSPFPESSSLS
jgi:hypothetical protein